MCVDLERSCAHYVEISSLQNSSYAVLSAVAGHYENPTMEHAVQHGNQYMPGLLGIESGTMYKLKYVISYTMCTITITSNRVVIVQQ